ncbi:hypothetical protein AACH06_22710 [Ideonella sp. DXS29W]|uniref:S9 family peptidase n=1 Tax=Ideonella lacteola TaxID=2984193 RepID=A0ABU9BWZ2_9BURK
MRHATYGVKTPVRSQGFELRVLLPEDDGPLKVSANGPGRRQRVFELSSVVGVVHRMWVVEGRLVVCSWGNHSLRGEVAVFNLNTGETIDSFWGQYVSASPDGRRIAFERFYPAPFAAPGESQYRLYDVLATPRANRPSYSKADTAAAMKADDLDRLEPGVALYPLSARELARPTQVDDPRDRHVMKSRLVWSPNGGELAVLDWHSGRLSLVRVDTSKPVKPGKVRAWVAPLPEAAALCQADDDDRADAEAAAECNGIDHDQDHVAIGFEPGALVVRLAPSSADERAEVWRIARQRLRPAEQARYRDEAG